MQKNNRRLFQLIIALLLTVNATVSFSALRAQENDTESLPIETIDPATLNVQRLGDPEAEEEQETSPHAASEKVRVSIVLSDSSTLSKGFDVKNISVNQAAMNYRGSLKKKQDQTILAINRRLNGNIDVRWQLTLAANVISAEVRYGDIPAIRQIAGVKDVFLENRYKPAEDTASPYTSHTSTEMTGAAQSWDLGYTGAGRRIAIIDTGIDTSHQSFASDSFEYSLSLLDKQIDLMQQIPSELNGKGTYISSKIPYGYNYIDQNNDITHLNDYMGEHGSHVAGIAAANRYVSKNGEYVEAISSVKAVGMAPDAQLLI
ncbi:MAG: S8 family serine peptidase, partial [Erysipelotrichaceae bacterium]|nr:S8 family serine peptidase [Erysipelotrichaceae bacterium]